MARQHADAVPRISLRQLGPDASPLLYEAEGAAGLSDLLRTANSLHHREYLSAMVEFDKDFAYRRDDDAAASVEDTGDEDYVPSPPRAGRSRAAPRRKRPTVRRKGAPQTRCVLLTGTKLLRLEHTFIQESENELLGLLTSFHKAVLAAPVGSPSRCERIISAAKAVNQLRFRSGDPYQELTAGWRAYCADALSKNVGDTGMVQAHMHPRTVLRAAASMDTVGAPTPKLWFGSGPLQGKEIRFDDFVKACESYQGECASLSCSDCPPQISKIGRQLAYYEATVVDLYSQVGEAPSNSEALALGERLMQTIDEHSALRVLLLWCNWRLSGQPRLQENLFEPSLWHLIIAQLRLTDAQQEASCRVRAGIRKECFDAQVAKECTEDIVHAMVDAEVVQDVSLSDRLGILDAVAAVHKAEVRLALLEVKTTCIFFQAVLTPIQKCFLTGLIQSRLSRHTGSSVVSFADLNKFIHASVVDEELSSWMDQPERSSNLLEIIGTPLLAA